MSIGGLDMAEGGFLVKFDGKEAFRCYAVAFDYDERQYIVNDTEKHERGPSPKACLPVGRELLGRKLLVQHQGGKKVVVHVIYT